MAERKVTSTLYLDGAPADEELNPFAIRLGPAAQRATGRKTTAKRKGDKPRNLNVRVKPQTQISAPRQNAPERVLSAIGRVSPGAEQTLRTVDDELLGLRELYGAGVRGVADALGGDVYGEGDLQSDDATVLALTGLAGPAFSAAGRLGGAALRRLPAGVRQGASDLAARARRYMAEARPLADADYVEGVFRDLPEEMGALEVTAIPDRLVQEGYVADKAARQANLEAFRPYGGENPRVFYHGTRGGDFSVFDQGRQGQSDFGATGRGYYFSEHPEVANMYAEMAPGEGYPSVFPAYLSVQNPYEAGALLPRNAEESALLTQRVRDAGHDAIILRGRDGALDEVVVLDPTQIKSATGNRGTYDPRDPDIRKARGGLAVKRKKRKAR